MIEGIQITNWNDVEYIRNSSGLWPYLHVRGVYQFNVSYRPHMYTGVSETHVFKQVSKGIKLLMLSQIAQFFWPNLTNKINKKSLTETKRYL